MSNHEVIFNLSGKDIDIDIVGTNRIEALNASTIKEDLIRLVNEDRANYNLNLDNIDFIDSLGLGVLVTLLKRIKSVNGNLALKGVNPQVRNLLELTRLTKVFEMEDNVFSPH